MAHEDIAARNAAYYNLIEERYNACLALIKEEDKALNKFVITREQAMENLAYLLPNSCSKWGTLYLILLQSGENLATVSLGALKWLNKHCYRSNYIVKPNANGTLRLYQVRYSTTKKVKRFVSVDETKVYNALVAEEKRYADTFKKDFVRGLLKDVTLLGEKPSMPNARHYAKLLASGELTWKSDPALHRRAIRCIRSLATECESLAEIGEPEETNLEI